MSNLATLKQNLVTLNQAMALKDIGFNEALASRVALIPGIVPSKPKGQLYEFNAIHKNGDNPKNVIAVPTVDVAIDWIRRKFNVVIFDAAEPFVDPIKKTIMYSYKVKFCNVKWGWNYREFIGQTKWSKDSYAMKRQAIWIAIRYIKKKKDAERKRKNKARKRGI